MTVDHDRLFKELLTTYFEEFMLLFFPEVYEEIDFSELNFLSEELYTDVTAGEKYRVDLLAETKLKGEDSLIIIHLEPQSYAQDSFNERMFLYFSRLYEKYRRKIVPIAIFSYDTIRNEPNIFEISFPFLKTLHYQFLKVELKKHNWRDFVRKENPVAAALLAKMGYNDSERIEVKKEFLRMIVRMNIDMARQTLLTGFFETYLKLSSEEENQLIEEVKQMDKKEGEKVMEVMVSYERRGMEKGIEKGVNQVASEMLKKGLDLQLITEVTGLKEEEVLGLKNDK
ncbi:Rpn family recombination-promoting nuclease/putative transposase [Bacillus shivajii]|uniref:Rpn family recombination-promoting nuclease/putative transposase n=1 Tax=Bacillus shivajii TaxID=1983719 RepID=UPI001CFC3863|nr:Rpn family recombination-promoting nuclease/putative transposase [Bacillus shivajii]UCZ53535.1 Rpn family recombination-promoting nuclease/putative transposase [Bacillus shivajii]